MSAILHWAMGLLSALVAWKIRKRNIGLSLVTIGTGLLIALAAGDYSVEANGLGGWVERLKFSTSGGLTDRLLAA
ncbi:hypothetical protein, partial [Pseudomonas syringae]|uniref:hypothetical protein n=1 Tax=Pseudomonas syringae TaxID=317 RepID=UPI001F29C375